MSWLGTDVLDAFDVLMERDAPSSPEIPREP